MEQDTREADVDIFVIGGGINGCGIARDAVGRGYSVALAEMNDLASGTSSWSTKLIHGGLRYLEHYEFRLVRESLIEREILWQAAPHIISPMRFVLPHHRGMRPAWLLRLGLFLYDHLGGRKLLPATKVLDLTRDTAGAPLKPEFTRAFEYSDCSVDDSRFVALIARDAANRGARIATRTKVVSAERDGARWRVTTETNGERRSTSARIIVNAAGPWVDTVLQQTLQLSNRDNVRLVQGSHIVVHRKFDHDRAYFFQNADGRIFFAIPYQNEFTLIGTTDRDWDGAPGDVKISDEEIDYLCEGASGYFREPVRREDVVWTYSGVRPLYDDGASKAQEATRDYVLRIDKDANGTGPAALNIFGGKITTYRRLAEAAIVEVGKQIGVKGAPWTAGATLPGGDFPVDGRPALEAQLLRLHPFLSADHVKRLVRLYGTDARRILEGVSDETALGRRFGADLYQREVEWLMAKEWAHTSNDVLWRRTKLGLLMQESEKQALNTWMREAAHRPGRWAAE